MVRLLVGAEWCSVSYFENDAVFLILKLNQPRLEFRSGRKLRVCGIESAKATLTKSRVEGFWMKAILQTMAIPRHTTQGNTHVHSRAAASRWWRSSNIYTNSLHRLNHITSHPDRPVFNKYMLSTAIVGCCTGRTSGKQPIIEWLTWTEADTSCPLRSKSRL